MEIYTGIDGTKQARLEKEIVDIKVKNRELKEELEIIQGALNFITMDGGALDG